MRLRRQPWLIGTLTVLTLCVISTFWKPDPWLLYNHTPSVPVGWYVYQSHDVKNGDVVAFRLPRPAHNYARLRNQSTDVLLLKPVVAMAGDHVSTVNGQLRINGQRVCPIPTRDTHGRALLRWLGSRQLTDCELFVYSAQITNSFDSRFFGPLHLDDVIGVYRKLSRADHRTNHSDAQSTHPLHPLAHPTAQERTVHLGETSPLNTPNAVDKAVMLDSKIKGRATGPLNELTFIDLSVSPGGRRVTGKTQALLSPTFSGVTRIDRGVWSP